MTDDAAAEAAAALNVRAFTVGDRVFFAAGHGPATDDGDLLAHELTHVAQQRGAAVPASWETLQVVARGDQREVAARDHDATAVRSELAIAADTGTAQKKTGDNAPDLPLTEPFRWIPSTYSLWMRSDWFKGAKDFSIDGTFWVSPSRVGALLGELAAKGMLSWVTPDVIHKVAGQIGVKPKPEKVFSVRLDVDVFALIGLPPGAPALVGFRDDKGLSITTTIENVAGDIGKKFPLSRAHKEQLIAAVEGFTHLKVRPDQKQEFFEAKISGELGRGAANFNLYRKSCDEWFGPDAYKAFLEKPGDDSKKSIGFGAPGESQTISDLNPAEIEFVQNWLKAHIKEDKQGGQPVVMTRLLYDALKTIDALPEKEKQKALEILRGDPNPKDPKQSKAPELTQVTAEIVERVIVQAKFEVDREAAGFDSLKHIGTQRGPVFDWEIPARLDQRSGLIVDGEKVEFNIEIDWPPPYTMDQDSEYRWRPMIADVDWLFERHHDDGFEHLDSHREHTVSEGGHASTSYRFKLDPGEPSGIWTVHAYVRHNYFQPKHLKTEVEVKPEATRLADLRKESFSTLGTHRIAEDDHHFSTSSFNETFGKHEYSHGLKFSGELPNDFARRTPAERMQSLDNEIAQQEKLLSYLRTSNQHPTAIDASTHYLAKLRDAKKSMAGDVKEDWQPFEIRGFYLGKGNTYFDGPLDLYATVRQAWGVDEGQIGAGQGAGAPQAKKVIGVEVKIRDLSRRVEAENYTFSGSGPTFESALEEAFVHLCKKYPEGKVSVLAEGFTQLGDKSTGKTVGFELATGTAWKDVKATLWDPVVDKVVNIGAAILMIIFPPTIPILLPGIILYNEIPNIDAFLDEYQSGTLTGGRAVLHLAQFGLDILPLAGRLPVFRSSKLAFSLFESVNLGGQAVLMTASVQAQVAAIRDGQIAQMGELYAKYVDLQKSTHQSDPNLAKMRAKLDEEAEQIRKESQKVWKQAIADFAIVALSTHATQIVDQHFTGKRIEALGDTRRFHDIEGVDPHYDYTTGRIIGDRKKLDRATLDKLTQQQDAHMREIATRAAAEIGVARDKIEIHTGAENRIHRSGDQVTIEFQPGSNPEVALKEWKAQAKTAKIGPHPDPHAGEAHKVSDARGTHHDVLSAGDARVSKSGAHAPATPIPDEMPRAQDLTPESWMQLQHLINQHGRRRGLQEWRNLQEGRTPDGLEINASIVPGSEFIGTGRTTAAPALVQAAAEREMVSLGSLFPGKVRSITKSGDAFAVMLADGTVVHVRIMSTHLPYVQVARSQVNTQRGEHTIQLSSRIADDQIQRALAHEVGEIIAETANARLHGRPERSDRLNPNGRKTGALSPHDWGRVAELNLLASKLEAPNLGASDRSRIRRELIALVDELGLRSDTAEALQRRVALVREDALSPEANRALFDEHTGVTKPLDKLSAEDQALSRDVKETAARRDQNELEAAHKRGQRPLEPLTPRDDQLNIEGRVPRAEQRRIAREAEQRREAKSAEVVAWLHKLHRAKPAGVDYATIDAPVWIGGGASTVGLTPETLFIDARGRWQRDAGSHIAQTAQQLSELYGAGMGDPTHFARPDERVPLDVIRAFEDNLAAQARVVNGYASVTVDDAGRTLLTVRPYKGESVTVILGGNRAPVFATGFPRESVPGQRMPLHDAVRVLREQMVALGLDPRATIGSHTGASDQDAGVIGQALRGSHEAAEIQTRGTREAKLALESLLAAETWESARAHDPKRQRVLRGDEANLVTDFRKAGVTEWVIAGQGGTAISAAEVILKQTRGMKPPVTVRMLGESNPEGLRRNTQWRQVEAAFGPGGENRLFVEKVDDVGALSVDPSGKASGVTVRDTDDSPTRTVSGGGYIVALGRAGLLPAPVAEYVHKVYNEQHATPPVSGSRVDGQLLWGTNGQYVGYRIVVAREGHRNSFDVTGAQSRFLPPELFPNEAVRELVGPERGSTTPASQTARGRDASSTSGNFDGGFGPSATQTADYQARSSDGTIRVMDAEGNFL